MSNAVNHDQFEKIKGMAFGAVDATINSLQEVFETRQQVARAYLQSSTKDTEMLDNLEYLNEVIRKSLYL